MTGEDSTVAEDPEDEDAVDNKQVLLLIDPTTF